LRTKVQFLEKKLSEDRDQLRKVSGLEEKSTHYENIIQKLQSKCQTFHQENGELKKEAKSLGERVEELEGIHAEHESILELATLDREMAEEKAESFKAELDAIENRLEEMELENEILRDENEELGKDMSPEEKTSQGWLQMQRENDRLRQALLRLRDLSREQEEGLKEGIRNLEEDTKELSQLKEQFETTRVQLLEMESDNEDLREQLDAALGAESMIEQLTDKNLTLGEQIEDLRKTVEHLQDLKELNDELEDNHVDHERQLQEVIDFKETQLTEMIRRTAKQDEDIVDRDYTISRFRELVSTMQSDLEDIRASKEISDLEAHNLEHSSRAIMDMNRQLQASATSATIKAIDIELGKLEATQASDQLSIVQLFVPEAFNTERDSILAYLRFKRVGFKARLLQGFVKQRISESSSTAGSMNTYAACDVLDKLTWMSAISDRFVACIETSNLDQFARFESTLHEVEPVERTLNGYLENLKKDDLQEMVVIDGLQRYFNIRIMLLKTPLTVSRSIAVMKHLSELYLGSGLETFAEEVLMRALLVQNNLENTATILTAARNDILQFAPPSPNAEDEDSIIFMRNSDSTLTGLRSAKVIAGKLHHVLRDMKVRNLSLSADTLSDFEKCNERSSALLDYFQTLGKAVTNFLHQEDPPVAIEFSTVLIAMRRTSSEYFETKNADTFAPALNNLRGLNDRLADLSNMASDLSQLTEFEKPSPPWILRSKELQDRKAISAVAEEEIKVLKRDIQERATTLKMRQQQLEEAKMKIELLDARNKEANKKLDRIIELEKDIAAAAERERSFEKAMEKQIETAQRLEEERDRWIRRAAEAKAMSGNVQPDGKAGAAAERLIGTSVEMDALKAQIAALQDTNCFLRVQCQRARAEEDAKANSWLSEPLVVSRRNRNPEKDEQRGRYRAVLSNIANLPKAARPLKLSDLPMSPDKEKQTRPKRKAATAKAQLIEQDANWLSAWNPIAMEMKGVPKMPLRIAGMEL